MDITLKIVEGIREKLIKSEEDKIYNKDSVIELLNSIIAKSKEIKSLQRGEDSIYLS